MEPFILYKYREDSVLTEEIFRNRKVWLSLPSQLNDPLECQAGYIPESWQAANIRQLEEAQLMGMTGFPGPFPERLFSLTQRQTKRWWKRMKSFSHLKKVAEMRKLYADHGIQLSQPENIFKDMRKRLAAVGVFSLSECCDNELMWAHYAKSHSGLAIGFKRDASCNLGNSRHTLPVAYMSEKPKFTIGFKQEITFYAGMRSESRVSFEDDVFRASLSTKTPAWSYEREWRYVEESHGLFDWPGEVVSVVFGLKMESQRRKYYQQLVREFAGGSVEYFEVKINSSLNRLDVVKI